MAIVSLMIVLAMGACSILSAWFTQHIRAHVIADMRASIFDRMVSDAMENGNTQGASEGASVILNDLDMIEENYLLPVLDLIGEAIQLLATIVAVVVIGWQYMLIILAFAIPTLLQPLLFRGVLARRGEAVSTAQAAYTVMVNDMFRGFLDIRASRAEDRFDARGALEIDRMESARKRAGMTGAWNWLSIGIVAYLLKVGTQLVFVQGAIIGTIAFSAIVTLFNYANGIFNNGIRILELMEAIQSTAGVRSKVEALLRAPDGPLEPEVDVPYPQPSPDIRIENLHFAYDSRTPVLHDLNVHFAPGEKVLVLGASGSGKSTLLRLLVGDLRGYEGSVRLGGCEVRQLPQRALLAQMAIVPQQVRLFEGTVAENIAMFAQDVSPGMLLAVAEAAGLAPLLARPEGGLSMSVQPGGQNLSVGERQRIAIARALLPGPDILLVDEGISALDNVTASAIEATLLGMPQLSVLNITHHLTDQSAGYDWVVVLAGGCVAADGQYVDLRAAGALASFERMREEAPA